MENESSLPCSQEAALVPILSEMNSVHIPPLYFLRIRLILSSHLRLDFPSDLFSFLFTLPNQNIVRISYLVHANHMARLSDLPLLDYPNNIWWWTHIMELIIMQCLVFQIFYEAVSTAVYRIVVNGERKITLD
jgi:hypothetical protein